jgi:ribosomal protein S4E
MAKEKPAGNLKDGAQCKVVGGVHAGKAGIVRDINTSKTGHVTLTVVQSNGERFKTLEKNVVLLAGTA